MALLFATASCSVQFHMWFQICVGKYFLLLAMNLTSCSFTDGFEFCDGEVPGSLFLSYVIYRLYPVSLSFVSFLQPLPYSFPSFSLCSSLKQTGKGTGAFSPGVS